MKLCSLSICTNSITKRTYPGFN
uniref:Uncharacterized protein n=1 Tax=Arundo donax TaxID=35708 RepID=A0A0A9A821_ARUDO